MGKELPEDLVEKAEKELGETPEIRAKTLAELRGLVLALPQEEQPHRSDDRYLLAFLRPQKFRVEVALTKIKAYTKFKKEYQAKLKKLKADDFRDVMEMGFMQPLMKKDQEGRLVMCLFPAKFSWADDSKDPEILLCWTVFWLEQTGVMFDPYVQVNGMIIIEDLAGFSTSQMASIMWGPMRRISNISMQFWRQACPFRLRGIMLLNEPTFVDILQSMIKLVTPAKIWERIHLLGRGEEGVAALHKLVSPDHLPPELGGKLEEKPAAWLESAMAQEKDGKLAQAF